MAEYCKNPALTTLVPSGTVTTQWVSNISRSELNSELLRIHELTAGLKQASAFGCHPQIRRQPLVKIFRCAQFLYGDTFTLFSAPTVPENGDALLSAPSPRARDVTNLDKLTKIITVFIVPPLSDVLPIPFRNTAQLHWTWSMNWKTFRWISIRLTLLEITKCYSPTWSTTTYATASMQLFGRES